MEKEKNILEELKGYLSLNIEISRQNAKDIYLSTKDSGCANVYLGKMIAFTEAFSNMIIKKGAENHIEVRVSHPEGILQKKKKQYGNR